MSRDRMRAAVAAGTLGGDRRRAMLLKSIADVARAIFGARAASILLIDRASDELVFEAVSGEGQEILIGERMPSSTGIAGWVVSSRQPLVIEDVSRDPRFSRDAAARTGYLPKGMMSAPLISGERAVGVLQVLDRPQRAEFSLLEMDLLAQFAHQAALAVEIVEAARETSTSLDDLHVDARALVRLSEAVEALEGPRRAAAVALLDALTSLLLES